MPSPVKCSLSKEIDNDNGEQYKYVCITSNQPDSKSYRNPNPNPNSTTKHRAIVNIQPLAPERISKWGHTSAGKFFVMSFHFFGSTGTIRAFGERFREGQCSWVSLLLAVLRLTVSPIVKVGGTCPRALWSGRHCIRLNIVTCFTYPLRNSCETVLLHRLYYFRLSLSPCQCHRRDVFVIWSHSGIRVTPT